MSFFIHCQPTEYKDVCQKMLSDLFHWVSREEENRDYYLDIALSENQIKGSLRAGDKCAAESFIIDGFTKENIRLIILRLVTKFFAWPERPWGTLLGLRPTKVVHRLIDQGWTDAAIIAHLQRVYGLSLCKAELAADVARGERRFFLTEQDLQKKIAVYVGIPFCPTRCLYCSFPSYALAGRSDVLKGFLQALEEEINHLAGVIREHELTVESLYVGGGTPTTMGAAELDCLLGLLMEQFGSKLSEFTVEAGRPDTINRDKLHMMLKHRVSRLSINPQTMNDATLQLIGRKHSSQETVKAFKLAREMGFNNINMDLIIGLPGEKLADAAYTLDFMQQFSPESITCHTMALKRASRLKEEQQDFSAADRGLVEEMMNLVEAKMSVMGLKPYYLYRQRDILADLENVGYAVPGRESIYNVQMMEERQTVIGLGGGSVSKAVFLPDFKVKRIFNPKDPKTYIEKIAAIKRKKEEFINAWLTRKLE
ncbi:MAG: coproporphyrinogen dehydrogenase HemZ [bacterium]